VAHTLLSSSISPNTSARSVSSIFIFSRRTLKVQVNNSRISLIFMLRFLTFVFAVFDVESTLDLNLDLHEDSNRNFGMYSVALCFAGAKVQHLVAVATFVPRFGAVNQ
jgi:hypothetical protein